MKKISWGLYGVGMALLLTSCVAKKKYVEAQNKITQLEQQKAECMQKTESLNTSLGTLQQTNSDLQRRYDSTYNVYTSKQTRWNDYTAYYDKQRAAADQLHQQLHQQLDDKIGAENIVTANNKVYVTLPEATLFTAGSTNLSSKGTEIINTLATTIGQNPDVEVNVATTPVYPASATAMNDNSSSNWNSTTTTKTKVSSDNNGSYAKHSTVKPHSYSNKSSLNNTTAKRTTSTKYKSEATRHTMRSNYASNKKYSGSTSSMAVARASTIVTALRQQGVAKAGIQVTDPVNKSSATQSRKYQVIVSPSMEGYNEMMGKNNIGTGMK